MSTSKISFKNIKRDDPEVALVEGWLASDPVHTTNGLTVDDAFAGEVVLISDHQGPLMAVRFQKALRAAFQFNPKARYRTAKVGREVVDWMKALALQVGCQELIVKPAPSADDFARKLGFSEFTGRRIII